MIRWLPVRHLIMFGEGRTILICAHLLTCCPLRQWWHTLNDWLAIELFSGRGYKMQYILKIDGKSYILHFYVSCVRDHQNTRMSCSRTPAFDILPGLSYTSTSNKARLSQTPCYRIVHLYNKKVGKAPKASCVVSLGRLQGVFAENSSPYEIKAYVGSVCVGDRIR